MPAPFHLAARLVRLPRWRAVRRATAVVLTCVVLVGSAAGTTASAVDPAEVEAKAGTLESDDLVAPVSPTSVHRAHVGVDLGPHGPIGAIPAHPFLEVPEDPPERG